MVWKYAQMRRCNRQIHILPPAVITRSLVSSLYTCSMECVRVFYDGITPGFLPMEMLEKLMINKKPCLTACITPYSESVTGNSLPGVHFFRCVLHWITRFWCQPQVQRTISHILGSQLRLGLPGLVPLKENKAWATMTIQIISLGCDCVQLYSTNVRVHLWGVFIERKTTRISFLRNPAVLLTRSLTG